MISASFAVLVDHRLYDAETTSDIIKIFSLPEYLVYQAALAAVIYMVVQYAFLLVQLAIVYDLELSERFSFRQVEKIAALQSTILENEHKLRGIKDRVDHLDENIHRASDPESYIKMDRELTTLRGDLSASKDVISAMRAEQEAIMRSNPASRYAYKIVEMLIDGARLLPVAVFGFVSMVQLVRR